MEGKLAERRNAGSKKKPEWVRKYRLEDLLDDGKKGAEVRYQSPRALGRPIRKVQVRDDGTW